MKKILFALSTSLIILTACPRKKDVLPPTPPAETVDSKIIDTAVLFSKEIYLWYGQLPATINSGNYSDPDTLMRFIRKYSLDTIYNNGIKTSIVRNVDRWSFSMKKSEWNKVSQGIAGDLGLGMFFLGSPTVNNDLRVKSVEKLSPAGLAGVKRGWRIIKINDYTSITTSDADIKYIVNAIFSSASATITFQKPDATTQTITLNAAQYQQQPLCLDTVYNEAAGKVGYMVYNSFLGDSTYVVNGFKRIFDKFTSQNVNNVIVDLRYNSGGYVWMEQLLANYLVNNSGNGKVMMQEQFNNKYPSFNSTDMFNKKGSLNLNRIYFIVSKATASASELLINSLLPVMPNGVKLIGSKTEGKAVGFFPIGVGDWYIFPVSFQSVNANNQGKYFDGFIPDAYIADGLDKDWGDKTENCLKSALAAINNNGVFAYSPDQITVARSVYADGLNQKLENPAKFTGAIETRRRLVR